EGAEQLNDWVLSVEPAQPPYLVNMWQIAARTGRLTPQDERAIRDLKRSASRGEVELPHFVEVSCAILLGDSGDVEYSLSGLTDDEVSTLRNWPIWTLHERGREELLLDDD